MIEKTLEFCQTCINGAVVAHNLIQVNQTNVDTTFHLNINSSSISNVNQWSNHFYPPNCQHWFHEIQLLKWYGYVNAYVIIEISVLQICTDVSPSTLLMHTRIRSREV